MAENQDGQEKTEEPTEKRIREAREKGQVPRSREFNTVFMLLVGSATVIVLGDFLVGGISEILKSGFLMERAQVFDTQSILLRLQDNMIDMLILLAPLFIVLTVVAILSSVMVGGYNFSMQATLPKFNKLDPIKGTKRIFGAKGLMELFKALAKVILVGVFASFILYTYADDLIKIGYQPIEVALANVGNDLAWFFLVVAASLIVVAAIDAPFQLWDNQRQLKMTRQELKKDHKDQEGSPEVKQRIRRAQMEMAQKRMMDKVPEADVVITNPTHFAVALKYDQEKSAAPIVVAKGADLIAQKIREIAFENNVPVLSAPLLARAIYYSTKLNHQIPHGLYMAVAKVLAYIFQLKTKSGTVFSKPIKLDGIEVPDEYHYD
ncbi:MAG: flagellar biosynthesis protein FlhB [Gammaproteobacteria bacterium]|nr:flagellar biosynthesis protein FlhB [Gammaproteobacteria bacterium]MDH5693327.1 flagellar biosynthesis protein FlhB [Gammaproteobacteria bacterium]